MSNMNGTPLLLAIIGHLIGDYLLQNDWMALNKKRSSFYYRPEWSNREWRWVLTSCFRWFSLPCVIHCLIWTYSVMLFAGWVNMQFRGVMIMLVLLSTHFIQDRTQIIVFWMTRINRQPKFSQPPMAPWSLVVVDNVWHIVTLWAVWKFIA